MILRVGETVRLQCPVSGAFRGLVRLKRISLGGLCTVTSETPILDWLSTGEDGSYPYRTYEIGHTFNAEDDELEPVATR